MACLCVDTVSPAKTDEPITIPRAGPSLVGPRNRHGRTRRIVIRQRKAALCGACSLPVTPCTADASGLRSCQTQPVARSSCGNTACCHHCHSHLFLSSLLLQFWHCSSYKKLSYRRGTARCVVSIEILPIATQQCRNYLYDKS